MGLLKAKCISNLISLFLDLEILFFFTYVYPFEVLRTPLQFFLYPG